MLTQNDKAINKSRKKILNKRKKDKTNAKLVHNKSKTKTLLCKDRQMHVRACTKPSGRKNGPFSSGGQT